jgi:cytochrome c-type biogenesis protein CcmH
MRTIIQQKIAAGESDPSIRQYFVDRYGSRVLLAPPKSSFNLLAWIMPFVGLAAGGLAVYLFLRSARGRGRAPLPATENEDAALSPYRRRAEQEIEQYE